MIVLPSDPDCSDLLMKTVWYQNVIITGNSSLNRRKCSRKGLLNDFIQAYLINFCPLYIYKMDLFILLIIIMLICCLIAEVRVEARGQGINITGVIMEWWHKVGIHDWQTGPWISRFSVLLFCSSSLSLSLSWPNVLEVNCNTFSPSKRSPLTANKFWFIFVFIIKFLISF